MTTMAVFSQFIRPKRLTDSKKTKRVYLINHFKPFHPSAIVVISRSPLVIADKRGLITST
jgi:hypothetical protein